MKFNGKQGKKQALQWLKLGVRDSLAPIYREKSK